MILLLAGCGLLSSPIPSVQGLSLSHLGLEQAGLQIALEVDNPLWVDVPLQSLRWELVVDRDRVAHGERTAPLILSASGATVVPIPVEIRYADLWEAAKHTLQPEVPYRLSLEADVVTPRGAITLPLGHEGTLPRLALPSIDVLDVDLRRDGSQVGIDLGLKLGLPAGWVIPTLDWMVEVDARLLGQGALQVAEDGTLQVPVRFDPRQAALASWDWAWGEATVLSLRLGGDVQTPLGTAPVSLEQAIPIGGDAP